MDAVYEKLGCPAHRSRTVRVPLPGGAVGGVEGLEEFSAYFRLTSGLPPMLAERLLRLYGVRAPVVLDEAGDHPSLRIPLISPYAVETA